MTTDELIAAIQVEITRLGLDWADAPFEMAMAADESLGDELEDRLQPMLDHLEHLRRLGIGATWDDVFDDSTPQSSDGLLTPTVSYRPLGEADYPAPPAGPAVLASWPGSIDEGCLERLRNDASAAGYRVYASWFIHVPKTPPQRFAYIVLTNDTRSTEFAKFIWWVETESDATVRSVERGPRSR